MDVRDIPKWSEDWQAEVYAEIEAADTFVCALSPGSVTLPSVDLELEHAVEQGKRLKPLLVRDVDAREVPEALGTPQWIDFRNEQQFEARFNDLLAVLATDVDWVQQHTRFQIGANEWQAGGEDSSLLLRRARVSSSSHRGTRRRHAARFPLARMNRFCRSVAGGSLPACPASQSSAFRSPGSK